MMRLFFSTLFLLTVPVLVQTPMMCGSYDDVVEEITGPKFREIIFLEATVGVVSNGPVMQTFANPTTRTWSQIYVPRAGVACVNTGGVNFGKAISFLPLKPKGVPL